jgi:hypothetical protein
MSKKMQTYHHQPINAPTAGVQTLFMDYTGEQPITRPPGPVRIAGWGLQMQRQRLNVP